jgi:predicted acetyltransferase
MGMSRPPPTGVTVRPDRQGLRPDLRLRLRPPRPEDEAAFVAAHRALEAEHFQFGLGYEDGMDWATYLRRLEDQRCGIDLPAGRVAATFLVADVDGELVGRTSIRHELTEYLALEGGHIGYAVVAEHRRRGYATEILRQSLVIARAVGIDRVLVTCDDGNVGSATVIERCGGVFHSLVARTGDGTTRRYWID